MENLWIDFVNSDWHDHRGREPDADRLDDPHWLREFLRKANLPTDEACRPEGRQKLKELRTLLQTIVVSCLERRELPNSQLTALNEYLGESQVRPLLVRDEPAYRMELRPGDRGLGSVQFTIAASLARFLTDGKFSRLKLCGNSSCRWLFLDETRSQTRRWCAAICGNLIKVRKFRRRRHSSENSTAKRRKKPKS